jgi:hypothetical protein
MRAMARGWPGFLVGVAMVVVCTVARGAERPYAVTEEREPCSHYAPERQAFFGDTHVHTTFSLDANAQDTRNTPRAAYRFAKGEALGLQPYAADGSPRRVAKLLRPLDFTAVTDHAEALGETRICASQDLPGSDSDICWAYRTWAPLARTILLARLLIARERFAFCGEGGTHCLDAAGTVWREIQAAAEEAYDRSAACTFTSFVGYEWTASVGRGLNLHRNVLFRNQRVPPMPASWVETSSAADLWARLQRDCVEGVPGCDALTIPHNSNLSGPGLMFRSARLTGGADAQQPVDREEAELRQRWEPLVEIMQHKGDSECMLGGDTTDEACGFEKLPYADFSGVGQPRPPRGVPPLDRRTMVREALKQGLLTEQTLGVNPLKYGIVASTDTHLGTPGLTREDQPAGHGGAGRGASQGLPPGLPDEVEFNPGGLAVLWAEENSRDALFAAMQRREAYGTSGTRPLVRFFGGWSYPENLCESADLVARVYAGGVPMGGDLPRASPCRRSPTRECRGCRGPRFSASRS